MAFEWPRRTQYKTKERISQILWTLKLDGDIEDKGCAIRVLMDRMRAHGVTINKADEHALRLTIVEISGGKYGDLIMRDVNGRRTQALCLVLDGDLPENYLPDSDLDEDEDEATFQTSLPLDVVAEPEPEPVPEPAPTPEPEPAPAPEPEAIEPAPVLARAATRPRLVAVPTMAPAAVDPDDEFDLIIAGLEAELEELRSAPVPEPVPLPTVLERVGAAELTDKAGVMNAILHLVGDLAVMVAGEPTVAQEDITLKDRLGDALEQVQRYRRRATDAGETAMARLKEVEGLKRQLGERDRQIARMEANIAALQHGERVENTGAARKGLQFVAAKPHHRRGASEDSTLVYSVG